MNLVLQKLNDGGAGIFSPRSSKKTSIFQHSMKKSLQTSSKVKLNENLSDGKLPDLRLGRANSNTKNKEE